MPTNKRRVAAYLSNRTAAYFTAYKSAKNLSDSEALNQILSAFFELEAEPNARSLIARVERLERIIGDADEF
jgi:hypothetical protein